MGRVCGLSLLCGHETTRVFFEVGEDGEDASVVMGPGWECPSAHSADSGLVRRIPINGLQPRSLNPRVVEYARAPRRCRQRGRPGRVRDERDATAARPRACGARATAGRRTVADRALGLAALPVPELVTRAARLRLLGRRPQRLRALARDPGGSRTTPADTRAPVREHTGVTGLRADDGGFVLSVPDGAIHARHVVVATGPFQRPCIPQFARDFAPSELQTDPTRYRRPEDLPDGAVLVVGSGHPAARSPRNCCALSARFFCRSPGTGESHGGSAARTFIGGWNKWAASCRRSTAFPFAGALRGSSSPA